MKTSAFNIPDLGKENSDIDSMVNMEEVKPMNVREQKKKKRKINFDFLFPAPKNNENMGMDNIYNEEPFKGIL